MSAALNTRCADQRARHPVNETSVFPTRLPCCRRFRSLPPWVRVLLTSRPQVREVFQAWHPKWIEPEEQQNQTDLQDLLRWRLQQSSHVAPGDVDAAASLLLRKSQGQFIYSKYVFEELAEQGTWTLGEMEARLPSGLQGMFRRVMDTLCDALRQEAPHLLELLQRKLLPVLVAVREPLTARELAWVVGGSPQAGAELEQQVSWPSRASGADARSLVVLQCNGLPLA